MSGRSDDGLLLGMLSVAVLAEMDNLRGTDEETRLSMARRLGYPDIKARPGTPEYYVELGRLSSLPFGGYPLGGADAVMFGGRGCAQAFAAWARALALLAYNTGGVTFGPLRWCAAHPRGPWKETDGRICPACLREEGPG